MELLLRSIKKKCPHRSKGSKRLPITIWVLRRFVQKLGRRTWNNKLIGAAMCCATYGLLRSGEFTTKPGKECPLLRQDITWHEDHVCLRIRVSKTDIFRQGVTVILWRNGSATCPYTQLKAIWEASPAQHPTAPVFQLEDGSPLNYRDLLSATKETAAACGFNKANFSGHSFRIGGATTLSILGFAPEIIKTLGRWTSVAYQLYTRVAPKNLQAAALAFGKEPTKSLKDCFGGLSAATAASITSENCPIAVTFRSR
jgi:hypothetical protein